MHLSHLDASFSLVLDASCILHLAANACDSTGSQWRLHAWHAGWRCLGASWYWVTGVEKWDVAVRIQQICSDGVVCTQDWVRYCPGETKPYKANQAKLFSLVPPCWFCHRSMGHHHCHFPWTGLVSINNSVQVWRCADVWCSWCFSERFRWCSIVWRFPIQIVLLTWRHHAVLGPGMVSTFLTIFLF